MQANRRRFIDNLRLNPKGRRQIDCALTDGRNGRCAMGLGLEGLGINLRTGFENEPYEEGAEALGFSYDNRNNDGYDLVWRLNDRGLTFAEIADELELEWEDGRQVQL